MRSNEFGSGKKDEDEGGESSSSSSSSSWEQPRQLDMSKGGEHTVELRPRFEPLSLPAPLLKELLSAKHDEPAEKPAEAAPADEVREREIATGPSEDTVETHEDDDDEDEEGTTSSTSTTSTPVAPPLAAPRPSIVEQLIEELDQHTEAEAAAPVEVDLNEQYEPVAPEPPASLHESAAMPQAPVYGEYQPPVTQAAQAPPAPGAPQPPNFPPVPPTEHNAFYYPEPAPEPAPQTPAEWGGPHPAFEPQQQFESTMNASVFAPQEQATQQAVSEAAYYAEKQGLRRGLIAGALTGYLIRGWIANRRAARVQKETQSQFNQRDRQIGQLQTQGEQLTQQVQSQARQIEQFQYNQPPVAPQFEQAVPQNAASTRYEQPRPQTPNAMPLQQVEQRPFEQQQQQVPGQRPELVPGPPVQAQAEQQQQVPPEQQGEQEIVLQPGQHVERRGWYSVVVDEHGREVQGAIQYGEAFQREQKELTPVSKSDPTKTNGGGAGAQGGGGGGDGAFLGAASVNPMIASGQADVNHELSAGYSQHADINHRLANPKSPVAETFSSPWLWAGIVILLIAFFVAALV